MVKKGTPASPAMALARSVFPVPGGPTSRHPFGILPPSFVNFFGSFKNSMISSSSSFASSIPATSVKVTLLWVSVKSLAFDLPKVIALPPPDCICRMKNIHTPMRRIMGSQEMMRVRYQGLSSTGLATILTLWDLSVFMSSGSSGA